MAKGADRKTAMGVCARVGCVRVASAIGGVLCDEHRYQPDSPPRQALIVDPGKIYSSEPLKPRERRERRPVVRGFYTNSNGIWCEMQRITAEQAMLGTAPNDFVVYRFEQSPWFFYGPRFGKCWAERDGQQLPLELFEVRSRPRCAWCVLPRADGDDRYCVRCRSDFNRLKSQLIGTSVVDVGTGSIPARAPDPGKPSTIPLGAPRAYFND